jgi:hypothetical protein
MLLHTGACKDKDEAPASSVVHSLDGQPSAHFATLNLSRLQNSDRQCCSGGPVFDAQFFEHLFGMLIHSSWTQAEYCCDVPIGFTAVHPKQHLGLARGDGKTATKQRPIAISA